VRYAKKNIRTRNW